MTRAVLLHLIERFFALGWIGKLTTITAALYALSWVAGGIGMEATADELGIAAGIMLAVLLTALIIRWGWQQAGRQPR